MYDWRMTSKPGDAFAVAGQIDSPNTVATRSSGCSSAISPIPIARRGFFGLDASLAYLYSYGLYSCGGFGLDGSMGIRHVEYANIEAERCIMHGEVEVGSIVD